MTLCECGCGQTVNPGRRFIIGHTWAGKKLPDEIRTKISKAKKGKKMSDEHRENIKIAHLQEKEPLPDGWRSKLSDITTNKKSAVYLGIIAETILSNIYKDVQVMPIQNPGYDVICNRDFLIDIKSSATGDKGHWMFNINKNQIADYFLCIAFNNRDDLHNPVHLWMIPGNIVNHLTGLGINKSRLDKWQQYELPLDKLISCCNSRHITSRRRA